MSDRPILFSAPMIRALLAGNKTQTRRALSKANTWFNGSPWHRELPFEDCDWPRAWVDGGPSPAGNPGPYLHVPWPYGRIFDDSDEVLWARIYPKIQPGDRLWVRENGWERPGRDGKMMRNGADTWLPFYYDADCSEQDHADFKAWGFKRRPSIHMPRWASRLTLIVEEVKVERLQDISEADAIAEGCRLGLDNDTSSNAIFEFQCLWDGLNAKRGYGWDVNPWVAAYAFRVIPQNIDQVPA